MGSSGTGRGREETARTNAHGFAAETRALVLRRTRIGIGLGTVLLAASIPVEAFGSGSLPATLGVRALACAALVALHLLSARKGAERFAPAFLFGATTVLAVAIFALIRLSEGAGDPWYAAHSCAMVLLVVGAGALVPIGLRTILPLVAIPVALHLLALRGLSTGIEAPLLFVFAGAAGVAGIASEAALRLRRSEYESRLEKQALLDARAEFVSMLTHDLKNPLNVIDGYAGLLEESPRLAPEDRALVMHVRSAERRALLLANNLLDVSRIGAGRLAPKPEPTDLGQLVAQVVENQRCLAEVKYVVLAHESDPALPEVEVDPMLLDRVLSNLVDNAIKLTPEGGTVRILARRAAEGGVEIVVEDTGRGLAPEIAPRLFERYATLSERRDSTGLGLFIVKSIVEAHGGTVSAANRDDGPGARFRIWLPLLGGTRSPTRDAAAAA